VIACSRTRSCINRETAGLGLADLLVWSHLRRPLAGLFALVLTMILPGKRDAILARADDYAYSRLICGVHYLTDVVASKSVAYAMIGIIANDPVFRKEFGTAKAETRYALDF